jgi:tetratricopeptide (TPR) repeat protein
VFNVAMRFEKTRIVVVLAFVFLGALGFAGTRSRRWLGQTVVQAVAQADPRSADYQAKRQKAAELFDQGRRLEALPLLEELVKSHPQDDQMLVALAACLVDHAATLSDQAVAGKERFRARDLLDQAWKLGNTSTLAQNLAHLLKELPASGALKFSDNPAVDQIMQAGEAAFARRDFDEAIKNYSRALELEPKNYSALLFIGNSYDRKGDFANARDWYQRAITLDPNVETAYRYCADMLAKQGKMGEARTMLIHAAVAEPYNRIVWRELHAWATINKTEIREIYIGQPAPKAPSGEPAGKQPSPELSPAWQAYREVRTNWQHGDAFQKHYPQETSYRHSLAEEYEALTAAAQTEEKLRNASKGAEPAAAMPSMDLLLKLYRAGLIEAYVLFSLGDDGIAHDYAPYRAKNRSKLEDYMDKFVVPK